MTGGPGDRLPRVLLLATTNPAKSRRLRAVFEGFGFELESLPTDLGAPPPEEGASFRENAERKAADWSSRTGGLVAASDGGLAVPALGANWNAVRTARNAGPDADDQARARQLLGLARGLRGQEREVTWSEGLALALDGRLLASWQADGSPALLVETFEPADLVPGFWAASLCYIPRFGTTLARLDQQQLDELGGTWSVLRARVQAWLGSG